MNNNQYKKIKAEEFNRKRQHAIWNRELELRASAEGLKARDKPKRNLRKGISGLSRRSIASVIAASMAVSQ